MQTEYPRAGSGAPPMGGPEYERDPLLDFAKRWWWLLAAGVLLGILGVLVYIKVGPTNYTSTALIQVTANTGSDPTDKATQARSAAPNFAAEGMTTRMYGLVSDAFQGTPRLTAEELSAKARNARLLVRQQRGTNFIEIIVYDRDAERARAIADTFAAVMVADINERTAAQNVARDEQLQMQIDFTRQQLTAAQLFDREQELETQLRDQQQRLLSLQASYRQEAARQLEIDRLAESGGGAEEIQGARASFEEIMIEQIVDVEQNIEAINAQLVDVRERISQLPPDTDPLIETAFASAYSAQLASLTSQYVADQISALSSGPPLVHYGDASAPVPARELKKLGLMGVVLGGALAAGVGLLWDTGRKRWPAAGIRRPFRIGGLFGGRKPYPVGQLTQAEATAAAGPTRSDVADAEASQPLRGRRR